jgi:S-adenosylmethionine hydrolase
MKTPSKTIALLTDFGLADHYVAVMKGVILSRAPNVHIVDITHGVSPQGINEAAYLLWASFKFFPPGTIFLCVVDPGVGSKRNIICADAGDYIFVAPDNGLLKYIFGEIKKNRVYSLTEKRYFLDDISTTFHGRDIFASVGAYLALGLEPSKLGKKVKPLTNAVRFTVLDPTRKIVHGSVIHVDRFGNLVTDLRTRAAANLRKFSLHIGSTREIISRFYSTYSPAPDNIPFMLLGSSGLVEVSVKNGNASKLLGVGQGERIKVMRKDR